MENSFKSLVDGSVSTLILLPVDPVFDEVAAGLSLFLSLGLSKKDVSIVCPSPMLVEFNKLIGVNKISTELGSKNLVIRFKDYQAENIEKVSYDIENGEFKLSVIPKVGQIAPNQNQVNINYSGASATAVILIGGEGEKSFPALTTNSDLASAKLIFLGIQAPKFAPTRQIISFARPVSSASEIAATLIKESGYQIDVDTATDLLLGIELSSNNFTLSGVTADTFQIVSDLVKLGGKREPLAFAKQQMQQMQQMMQNPTAQQQFRDQLQQLSKQPTPQPAQPPIPVQPPIVQPQEAVQQVLQQTASQPQPTNNQVPVTDNTEAKEGVVENPPVDWLNPKIYKGTSVG